MAMTDQGFFMLLAAMIIQAAHDYCRLRPENPDYDSAAAFLAAAEIEDQATVITQHATGMRERCNLFGIKSSYGPHPPVEDL